MKKGTGFREVEKEEVSGDEKERYKYEKENSKERNGGREERKEVKAVRYK